MTGRDDIADKARRLRAVLGTDGGPGASSRRADALQEGIEAELRSEAASALGRAGDKVEKAIAAARAAAERLDAASPSERGARLAEYEGLRKAADKALWQLRVHREALGLRRHDELALLYPMPPRRR